MQLNIDTDSMFRVWRHVKRSEFRSKGRVLRIPKALCLAIFYECRMVELRYDYVASNNHYTAQAAAVAVILSQLREDYIEHAVATSEPLNAKIYTFEYQLGFCAGLMALFSILTDKNLKLDLYEKLIYHFLMKSAGALTKKLLQHKLIILHSEMQTFENFIAQLAKTHDIRVAGLQHGFYAEDQEKTLNRCNYTKVGVDNVLVWGEYTSRLLKKYNPGVVTYTIGRPITAPIAKYLLGLSGSPNTTQPYTSIVIVLDSLEFRLSNIDMMDIVVRNINLESTRVFIKKHPNDTEMHKGFLILDSDNIGSIGDKPLFLGSRSTLMIELALVYKEVFLLNTSPLIQASNENLQDVIFTRFQRFDREDVVQYIDGRSLNYRESLPETISQIVEFQRAVIN